MTEYADETKAVPHKIQLRPEPDPEDREQEPAYMRAKRVQFELE